MSTNATQEEREECKRVLTDYLSSTRIHDIDAELPYHLIKDGHDDWLGHDVTEGPHIGNLSESVLGYFYRDNVVFDNPHLGQVKVDITYGPGSVPYYDLKKVGNSGKRS